ncbi:hypothetical protein BASA84_000830 [Batrachochytrium salamandrivorans]|nr:hypothetical protein BASA84_000830 [Batrachochytrium salamandrivorans]
MVQGVESDIRYQSYSPGFGSMEDSSVSNTFGQAYFNPVGVYTNGACYSACEVFAAHIQDYDVHCNTSQTHSRKAHRKTSQKKYHNSILELVLGARQLIRGGNYAAYDRIANYLGDVAKRQMDGKTYFISEPYSEFVSDESIDIPFVASGVDEIISFIKVNNLEGKKRGKQVFKTYRAITKVPTSNDRVSMMIADSYTVSGPSSGVGVYNFGSMSEQEGWNFNDGKWIIGDGISDYSGYMYSIVRVWLTAPVDSTISVSLDAVIDAYEDEGYFSLDMMDDFGEIFLWYLQRVIMV